MKRLLLFCLVILGFANAQHAQQEVDIVEGELLVQLDQGATWNNNSLSRNSARPQEVRQISVPLNIYLVRFDSSLSYEEVAKNIGINQQVLNIMPNMKVTQRRVPNDKHYEKQEDLRRIDLERAWTVTTGGETALGDRIVVAVMDSGYGVEIQDINENHYRNEDEELGDANQDGCPGDCGVDDDLDGLVDEDAFNRLPSHPLYDPDAANDDDENGYIDDVWGLNMQDFTDRHPADKHGTSVAGIIGASGNNKLSVTGVNWDVEMMLISNVTNIGQIVEAYTYVYNKRRLYNETDGAKGAYVVVTNFSSGIDKRWGYEFPIWCDLYDLLGEEGVLSVGATTNTTRNVDEEGDLPTTCESDYLISVTNLDLQDRLGSGGYGGIHIDLGAPGTGTITTSLTDIDNVGEFSGTSAATPHVAGAIALLHSIPCVEFATYYKENPSAVNEIKHYMMSSVDKADDLRGKAVSEGRLNVYNTMVELRDFCPGTPGQDLKFRKVFPNPSYRELITVEFDSPDGEGAYQFMIYNVNGQIIHTEVINVPLYGEKVFQTKIPTLAPGVYYFVIGNEKEMVTHRHVIIPY